MFDPRKLKPFSVEFCRAPIAVITEMTEKTPIVMPSIVSAERSLFAPNELQAILMISRNNISKNPNVEYRNPKQIHKFQHSLRIRNHFAFIPRTCEQWRRKFSSAVRPRIAGVPYRIQVCHRHLANQASTHSLWLLDDKFLFSSRSPFPNRLVCFDVIGTDGANYIEANE